MGLERAQSSRADDFIDGFADHLVASAIDEMRISLADEAVGQIAAAAHQHERRAIDDRLQLRLAGAQRLFGTLALGQFLKAADRAIDIACRVLQWRDINQDWNLRAVRPLNEQFRTS